MTSDNLEVVDASIIALLSEPLARVDNLNALFTRNDVASLMRQPVTVSQAMLFDAATGPQPTYQLESMKSQKTVNLSALRIDVHDLSGQETVTESKLPALLVAVADELEVSLKAVGANFAVTFRGGTDKPASAVIAERAFPSEGIVVPNGMTITGGSLRVFLSRGGDTEVSYIVAIEPRGQDATTPDVWMLCNANMVTSQMPVHEKLSAMLNDCRSILFEVKSKLFSDIS